MINQDKSQELESLYIPIQTVSEKEVIINYESDLDSLLNKYSCFYINNYIYEYKPSIRQAKENQYDFETIQEELINSLMKDKKYFSTENITKIQFKNERININVNSVNIFQEYVKEFPQTYSKNFGYELNEIKLFYGGLERKKLVSLLKDLVNLIQELMLIGKDQLVKSLLESLYKVKDKKNSINNKQNTGNSTDIDYDQKPEEYTSKINSLELSLFHVDDLLCSQYFFQKRFPQPIISNKLVKTLFRLNNLTIFYYKLEFFVFDYLYKDSLLDTKILKDLDKEQRTVLKDYTHNCFMNFRSLINSFFSLVSESLKKLIVRFNGNKAVKETESICNFFQQDTVKFTLENEDDSAEHIHQFYKFLPKEFTLCHLVSIYNELKVLHESLKKNKDNYSGLSNLKQERKRHK
eukprot:CAMPEP_0170537340 /NCGR_PEP_ID=MMETSP0209-20121228/102655_1 /TAXON_ID=665100 ORGANISM="Litonotus pictus, Strain P1" /NCGR_SAMPLE_ID=MMETSP0209 /ASSEMBLY_ACC=CAM_ASM_000301 /LENGTH=407 /DNA_ID=CAMNT_0010838819 /DNA_START=6297 /DNA_END=7520 /DNA_ORIENTATION=-